MLYNISTIDCEEKKQSWYLQQWFHRCQPAPGPSMRISNGSPKRVVSETASVYTVYALNACKDTCIYTVYTNWCIQYIQKTAYRHHISAVWCHPGRHHFFFSSGGRSLISSVVPYTDLWDPEVASRGLGRSWHILNMAKELWLIYC